ncbi:hypothetical protein ACFU9F_20880 [Streptomyces zhihengii]|uniref:hypothetical protein n=1 Tax=Streptomyces zhihengii TaxID=1818004 RepID=UPI0036C18FC0
MDAGGATAWAVAVTGVAGTLFSALLTQRAADRGRLLELDRAERRRAAHEDETARRGAYVALNMSARHYLVALSDQMHAVRRGGDAESVSLRLDEARDHHRDVHAEAQMALPDSILDLAGEVNRGLNALYGTVRRLDDGTPRDSDSPEAAQRMIDAMWAQLRSLRQEMRRDLGVSGADPGEEPGSAGRRPAERPS